MKNEEYIDRYIVRQYLSSLGKFKIYDGLDENEIGLVNTQHIDDAIIIVNNMNRDEADYIKEIEDYTGKIYNQYWSVGYYN